MFRFYERKRTKFQLGIAPLVDVVFQLLLFFLLTSQFIQQPGLKIELPRAQHARPQDRLDIVIAITKDNVIFLNGIQTNYDTLPDQLFNLLHKNPKKIVIIKADKDARVQSIVSVMDIAKRCNAEGVTLSTELENQ
jgi:biopolymer transport protein ExbD